MCVNTPTGPTCLCAEGFQLFTDNLTCIGRSRLHEKRFIVNNETLFSMLEISSFNGGGGFYPSTQVPYIIESFTVDANLDLIYFVDGLDNTLKEFNILTTQLRKLSYIPYAKALIFDWIANLLGWIEPTQSNIRAFSITSGKMSTIYSGLQEPSSLTVDAHNSYLFWISGSSEKSIMRGTWNKDSPQVILSSATLNNPSSLYYDVTSNRIYWLEDRHIASSMTNGFDAQYHLTTNGATQALVYKGFFVWINGNKMYVARKDTMHEEYSVDIVENSKGVAIFDPSLQQDRRGTCHILNGGCEDICVPTQRGRRCECDLGLEIKSDNTTCDSVVFSTNFIVVEDMIHRRFLQVDIDTGHLVKLPIYPTISFGIMFDKSRMELLYCELSTNAIMSTTLDGKNSALVYATGGPAYPIAIAIDYSTGNIYYTADSMYPNQGYVGVVHRINLLHKTLFSNLYHPRDIVVYPSKGLYWTDQRYDRIEYSDLNGGNRRILTTDDYADLMDIVIHGQYLYYTAYTRQRITKMDKATGLKVTFMSKHPEISSLWDLAIYADDVVDVSTYCSTLNGNCSTFCFPTPSGRTCGCQDNVDLQSDHTTCQGVTRCNTSQQNVNVLNCSPYSGQTCEIECKAGWKLAVNMSITCGPSGQWSPPTADLCTEIFCPPSVDNVMLSSSCGRKVGEACKFSCTEGNTSSTSQHLVCNDDGTWNQNMSDLCTRLRCSKIEQNGRLVDCESNAGDTCRYECNSRLETNPSIPNITCGTNGDWSHNINDLCVLLCPSTIPNGELAQCCQRRVGNSCTFTCSGSHRPSTSRNIVCTSDGTWSENINLLCKQIACPLELKNGNISSLCRGRTGEKCDVICHKGYTASYSEIVCTLSGAWNRNSDDVCVKISEEKGITVIGVGSSIAVIVIVTAIVVSVCFVRRRKPQGNESEEATVEDPISTLNGGYLTGLENSSLRDRLVPNVYSSVNELHVTEYEEMAIETTSIGCTLRGRCATGWDGGEVLPARKIAGPVGDGGTPGVNGIGGEGCGVSGTHSMMCSQPDSLVVLGAVTLLNPLLATLNGTENCSGIGGDSDGAVGVTGDDSTGVAGNFIEGIPRDKGLIIGTYTPLKLLTFTEIPSALASHYRNISTPLNSTFQITSITSDPYENTLFTIIGNSIYAFSNFSIWQNQKRSSRIYKGKSYSWGQIASDYVSKNLYWCDFFYRWIVMKPAYTSNNTIYRVVIDKDLEHPDGIALDPEDGLMFFSDYGGRHPRIERASLDGNDRVVIVQTGLIRAVALSVDTVNNILYWSDYGRHTLEACNYDGSSRRVVKRINDTDVTGIHYYQNIPQPTFSYSHC
ncbi:low-density lipoprotein receptor-related protein 2-like [Ostrea edulis]|uniref:low-density lipoprotein receptor-related protein 2-like n=1 Tax=Ostrea edulis TaxID=37623 RepID=UPI0024AF5AD3|nr:low-density lipoprotein receptor-related protein 2-like [Ostrea edulis]